MAKPMIQDIEKNQRNRAASLALQAAIIRNYEYIYELANSNAMIFITVIRRMISFADNQD